MSDLLLVEKKDGVLTLTFNRPDKMNALNRELRKALYEGLKAAEADDEVGVVILTGAGKAFCAGLDLKELGGETKSESTLQGTVTGGPIVEAFDNMTKPVIGAINGVAITGGFEVALACDVLIASTHARFADTHAKIGVLPRWGMSALLPRRIGLARAKEMTLSGRWVEAEEAAAIGLVNRVVPHAELRAATSELAGQIAGNPARAVVASLDLLDRGEGLSLTDALALEDEVAGAFQVDAARLAPAKS